MSSESELQEEEREVLLSIYEGEESFKQIDANTFQFKYGENDSVQSFILEIKWGDKYPNDPPGFNMDLFYNKHVNQPLKDKIVSCVATEAEQYLGMSMTYSLFEFVKEQFDTLIQDQPSDDVSTSSPNKIEALTLQDDPEDPKKNTGKKEIMTKSQKRRMWNRMDNKGEKPRGWDWVDLVRHLSQMGTKESATND